MRAPTHVLTDQDRQARARLLEVLGSEGSQSAQEGAEEASSPEADPGPGEDDASPAQAAPALPAREEILALKDKDALADIIEAHGGSADRRKSVATLAAEAVAIVHGPD